jgi:hypothetical protein
VKNRFKSEGKILGVESEIRSWLLSTTADFKRIKRGLESFLSKSLQNFKANKKINESLSNF